MTLDSPKVQIEAYGDQTVHRLGSCVLHLHIDNKALPTIFEVTDTVRANHTGQDTGKSNAICQVPKDQVTIYCHHVPHHF